MRLGRKNLLYSMALAGIMMLFFVGYFIYMLPSLYVDYRKEQNLDSIREQHRVYREQHTYDNVQVQNVTACFSIEIPKKGNYALIAGKLFSAQVVIREERLLEILERLRKEMAAEASRQKGEDSSGEMARDSAVKELADIFGKTLWEDTSLPVEIRLLEHGEPEGVFFGESVKQHYFLDGVLILEAEIWDRNNRYTTYIALEQTEESFIISYLPVVTPEMDEIRPVVLQSLPMLGAVILLLVLLFSQCYSRGIVAPVVKLVRHTEEFEADRDFSVPRLYPKRTCEEERRRQGRARSGPEGERREGRDEIRQLADTLDDFYLQIKNSYRELEEENKRQEIFLRASSHQLKTPIAAALLLTDGMIHRIGKYRDRDMYLPKVKEQLLSMRKMAEDILYLNRCTENMQPKEVDLWKLAEERLGAYQTILTEKGLQTECPKKQEITVFADETVLSQILDNLLSNAVKYTPEGGKIEISPIWERPEEKCFAADGTELWAGEAKSGKEFGKGIKKGIENGVKKGIRIENFGVTIPEELLPRITEPFVRGSHEADTAGIQSHGLGLYIAAYYARKIGAVLRISSGENSVTAELTLEYF